MFDAVKEKLCDKFNAAQISKTEPFLPQSQE
jgi:hypothetical protein